MATTTYSPINSAVRLPASTARLTARSKPHMRCRSIETKIAPRKKGCTTRCATGVIIHNPGTVAGSISGTKDSAMSAVPSASQPSPTRSSTGPDRHRRATSAAATNPTATTGASNGTSETSVKVRARKNHAVTSVPATSPTRAASSNRWSRTSHGITRNSASVPGIHAVFCSGDRTSTHGRSGRTAAHCE